MAGPNFRVARAKGQRQTTYKTLLRLTSMEILTTTVLGICSSFL